ncbi:hypothetical protein ERJ70_00310 [Sediminibacillus dalangtanensis]|uniref:Thioredoxin n=1 Tax=Sediminibacillus dalangtanensis TaxID=2729421 RepID=A0ABX7VTK6_9BACI|nr:hypothetical protein [Sediminibacillus dalangtanensis]QTM97916.1 hypothetical protein ERJ70_00310 [Sediminibacillus dalangtanensis]
MDRNCAYCSINFEEFFNLSKDKNFFVLFKKEDHDKAEELADLYDFSFEVYLTDKELFKEMQLRFMPAFVKVGCGLELEKATPIPLQVINSF